jgi:hypothetical protein
MALKMPIIVSYDTTIAALKKGSIIIANDNIHFAMIRIGLYSEGIYGGRGYIAIRDSGKIIFKGAFSAAKGCTLKAWGAVSYTLVATLSLIVIAKYYVEIA